MRTSTRCLVLMAVPWGTACDQPPIEVAPIHVSALQLEVSIAGEPSDFEDLLSQAGVRDISLLHCTYAYLDDDVLNVPEAERERIEEGDTVLVGDWSGAPYSFGGHAFIAVIPPGDTVRIPAAWETGGELYDVGADGSVVTLVEPDDASGGTWVWSYEADASEPVTITETHQVGTPIPDVPVRFYQWICF